VQLIALIIIAITLHQPLISLLKDSNNSNDKMNSINSNRRILDEILNSNNSNFTYSFNSSELMVNNTPNDTDGYVLINDANNNTNSNALDKSKNDNNLKETDKESFNKNKNPDNKEENNLVEENSSNNIFTKVTKNELINYSITLLFLIWELYANFIVYNYTKQINAGNDAFVDGQPFNRYVEDLAPSENSSRNNTPQHSVLPESRNNINIELNSRV
jgi:hypothetical protein